MNSQFNTDARIDQVLNALRTTEPPTGLEQRIAARLAQAAEARTQTDSAPSCISVILNAVKDPRISLSPAKFYSAAALTVVIALTTLTILHRHPSTTTQRNHPFPRSPHRLETLAANPRTPQIQPRGVHPREPPPRYPEASPSSPIALPISRGFSPGPTQDPDAIALAETLAPSRPAPPMPLTAQEKLIQAATRPGQPIQLAELDLARAPMLRAAAKARETASIDRYVKTLLAPFAVADALQPTTYSQPQEAPTSAPAEPTSNPSN